MSEHKPHSRDDFAIVREAISFDYLGPDSNDMDGERWGQDPEAIAALRRIEEQLETYRSALDAIVNAKSHMNTLGYVVTGDEAQELAIKRAADLVSNPASSPSCTCRNFGPYQYREVDPACAVHYQDRDPASEPKEGA